MNADSNTDWQAAVARAADLAPGFDVQTSWDDTAIRGLIAITAYAIARRKGIAVPDVPLADMLPPLLDRQRLTDLVTAALPHPTDTAQGSEPDPAEQQWAWLHRRWDPNQPPGQRWDGMARGITRGVTNPAIEVCLSWAANAIARALEAERDALSPRTEVLITAGDLAGQHGVIKSVAWRNTTDAAIESGPPAAYLVRVPTLPEARTARILVADLTIVPPGQ